METLQVYLDSQSNKVCHITHNQSDEDKHYFFVSSNEKDEPKRFLVMDNMVFLENTDGEYFKYLSFPQALTALSNGYRVTRETWKLGGSWIETRPRDKDSLHAAKLIIVFPHDKEDKINLWYPSTNDLFATDWKVLKD